MAQVNGRFKEEKMTTTQMKKDSNGSDVEGLPVSRVYYSSDPMKHLHTGLSGVFPYDFVAVASIQSDDLDEIWKVFNEIEEYDNVTNAHVILRSMCIGDVVSTPDGKNWILTNDTGWTPIDFEEDIVLYKRRYERYRSTES